MYPSIVQSNQSTENFLHDSERMNNQPVSMFKMAKRQELTQLEKDIHRLKNILTPIVGLSEVLLHDYPTVINDHEKAKRYLEIIQIAAGQAMDFVRCFRAQETEQREESVAQRIDLNTLVEETVSSTQGKWQGMPRSRAGAIKIVHRRQSVPSIRGHKDKLREVLINLIYNAVDAMPTGGEITISTAVDGPFVTLKVTDTGIGMTEEIKRRCFSLRFTTKPRDGFGIGLSTVAETIREHQGEISVESQPGVGTTFIIALPIFVEEV